MKTLLALALNLLSLFAYSQAPAIQWQNTIGGNSSDTLTCIRQTADGGYIAGGYSGSNISGDKTEASSGSTDYWIMKLNASGGIEWQNTIGGTSFEHLLTIQQTSDGGFIGGGTSNSPISGDKTENSLGSYDIWVVKLNSSGSIQWENTIGSTGTDGVVSIQQTTDGGYILGAYSNGDISADKTEDNFAASYDYWIIKLDSSGSILWQNTIGGNDHDNIYSIIQTTDGGFFLGGTSSSLVSGDKTESSLGYGDYWVVKLDAGGNIQWQNNMGGEDFDFFQEAIQTADGGYFLGGYSNSSATGDKAESRIGFYDYWAVKLNSSGNIQWEKTIGGTDGDYLSSVEQTADGGYILGGKSGSDASGDKTENRIGFGEDLWVVRLNALGNVVWDNTIGADDYCGMSTIHQTTDGGFILGGTGLGSISGDKTENSLGSYDYWVIKLAPESGTTCNASFAYTNQQTTYTFQNTSTGSNLSYAWNFADGNTSALQNPVHTFASSGTYNVCLTISNTAGCSDIQCNSITVAPVNQNLVWPGDANADGIANNFDLFAIGIGFGISGTTRVNATNNWIGQTSTDWQLQLAGGANLKHVDCDGDGVIGFSDVSAIQQNYGLTHSKGGSPEGRANSDLYLVFPLDSFFAGDTVTGELHLGTATAPVSNVYSIAFSMTYDQTIVDSGSFRVDFVNSWMAPNSNRISLSKDFYSTSRIEAGVSRIDHNNISGAGKIADVSFVIQDNIDGKDYFTLPLQIQFENVQAIGNDEAVVEVSANGDTLYITGEMTGIQRVEEEYHVSIFPNPTQGAVTILSESPLQGYSIADLTGKEIMTVEHLLSNRASIDLSQFDGGVYLSPCGMLKGKA